MANIYLSIFPNQFKKADNQPDYKVSHFIKEKGSAEVGGAWKKQTGTGKVYLSLGLDVDKLKGLLAGTLEYKQKQGTGYTDAKNFVEKQREQEAKPETIDEIKIEDIPF